MTATLRHPTAAFFEYNLSLELKLDSEGTTVSILSGHIESLSLNLHSYGFNCQVQFASFDNQELDDLFSPAKLPNITKATLSFKSTEEAQSDPLLELQGIVTQKIVKRVDQINERPQAIRVYEIIFTDTAKVEWEEHFPLNIYVEKSMKHVIDEHKTPDISIDYNFPPLETIYPILAFSLPYQSGKAPNKQTSFYSFLMWYLQKENGVWGYNYDTHSYSISQTKESEGEAFKIFEPYVTPPTYIFPENLRYSIKTIKHSPTLSDVEDLLEEKAFESIRRDMIVPLTPADFLNLDHHEVKSLANSEEAEVRVIVSQFFRDFHIDKLVPGRLVAFQGDPKSKTWSLDPLYKDKTFRVRSMRLEAYKPKTSEGITSPVEAYQLSLTALLEQESETFVERPAFNSPKFPFPIHGTILSDIGDVPQTTYTVIEADETPQCYYLVTVPVAGEGNEVIVPFTPDFMTGQYYFPLCKGEKVVLSMSFQSAKIERILDWQPLARLPQGVQGNQIMLGSNGPDKYAFVKHEFEDLSNSVVTIKQSSSETQTQTIRIQEKSLLIEVQENGKKSLVIQLNQDASLSLSLQDIDSGMTQKIVLDGKTLSLTCKNKEATSQYVQKPDSISLTCNEFNVSSEKINLHAKDSITQKGDSKIDIEAPVINMKSPSIKMG